MATPRKVGSKWRIELQVSGRKLSGYFDTKQEAINYAIEQRVVMSDRGYVAGRTMAMLFDRYANEVVAGRKGERWDRTRLAVFERRFGAIQVMQFSTADIEQWRDERLKTVKASTFNRELKLLSACLSEAERWRWRSDNPARRVKRPKDPPHRRRVLSADEVTQLLAALNTDLDDLACPKDRKQEVAFLMLLALRTAMRLGEIATLRWEHIYLDQNYLHLPETKTVPRDVPLDSEARRLLRILEPRESGKLFSISRDVASTYFSRAVRECGINDLHFHDTRRTAVVRMSKLLDVMELARTIGHSGNLRSLMIYYERSASSLADRLG